MNNCVFSDFASFIATALEAGDAAQSTSVETDSVPCEAIQPVKHTGSKLKEPAKTMDGRNRQRKVGAGRLSVLDLYPNLPEHIDTLINWRSPTFGSPMDGPIRVDKVMSEIVQVKQQ